VTVCFLIQMHSSRREKRPTPKVCSAEAGVLSSPGQSRLPASDTQRGAEASACGGQIHHDIIPDPGRRLNFEICRACQHFLLEPLARTRQEFSYTLGDDDAPPDGSVCSLYVLCLNSQRRPCAPKGACGGPASSSIRRHVDPGSQWLRGFVGAATDIFIGQSRQS
jgi:hypothetical protein